MADSSRNTHPVGTLYGLVVAAVLGHWDMLAIEQFRNAGWRNQGSGGPTRLLILDWQRLLPTVTELYGALYKISMLHACQLLRDYVPEGMVRTLDNHRRQPGPGPMRQGALYQGQLSQGAMRQESAFQGPIHQGPMYQRSMPQGHVYPGSMHQGPMDQGPRHDDLPMPTPPPTTNSIPHPSQGHLMSQQGYNQAQEYSFSQGHNFKSSTSPVKHEKVFGDLDGFSLTSMPKSSALSTSVSKMESLECRSQQAETLNSSWRPTPATRQSLNKSTSSINPRDGISKGTAMTSAVTFPYQLIQEATNDFDKQNLLGEGGFGYVYRAVLKRTIVAVKVLKDFERPEDDQDSIDSHLTEISSLFTYRHVNIINLIGYSIYGPKTCLVYEYMTNGSLEDRIQRKGGTSPLRWENRVMIMMGAASGLQFLHTAQDKPLIHGDIKSANILLDQNMQAKLSDFGQARQATGCTQTGDFTHVTGDMKTCPIYATRAYLPSDFFNDCRLSVSTDTYSFGVVLFEVCTGQKALDYKRRPSGDEYLRDYIRNANESVGLKGLMKEMDPVVPDWPLDIYTGMMQIGLDCTGKRKKARPDMLMVHSLLQRLEGERRIREFNVSQRRPPQGSSDNSDSSGLPSDPAGLYSPPRSHHMAFIGGDHPGGKLLEPPSSVSMSNSFSSCYNRPDGESDMPSADDACFAACDISKLTHSEKILETCNAALRVADIAGRMQNLDMDQPGTRNDGMKSYTAQASFGSYTKEDSVPYRLQKMHDELVEEKRELERFNAQIGLGYNDNVQDDLLGQPNSPSTQPGNTNPPCLAAKSPLPSSATHLSSDITLDVTGHMALLNSKSKKSFPFASNLDDKNCDECTEDHQDAGPVPGVISQARDIPNEGGMPGDGLQQGLDQGNRQRATENEVTPSPTSSFNHQSQTYPLQPPRQNQVHAGSYTDVQPGQVPHFTAPIGNYQIGTHMTNSHHNDTLTNRVIPSRRIIQMTNQQQYSFAAPDSEEIHSSDLYDSDCIEPTGGGMGFPTGTHIKGQPSMKSTDSGDQRRIARSLELLERRRRLSQPKETRDFDEH